MSGVRIYSVYATCADRLVADSYGITSIRQKPLWVFNGLTRVSSADLLVKVERWAGLAVVYGSWSISVAFVVGCTSTAWQRKVVIIDVRTSVVNAGVRRSEVKRCGSKRENVYIKRKSLGIIIYIAYCYCSYWLCYGSTNVCICNS